MISLSAFLPEMIATIKGHLADVLGIELADKIENQYRIFFRLSYYMDLMMRLWFAPTEIDDRSEIQEGFRIRVISTLQQAMETYPAVQAAIVETKNSMAAVRSKDHAR